MKPPLGITAQVKYDSNYDGDTLDFIFTQKVKVRVTNEQGKFDTPERGYRSRHNAEKFLAEKARERVHELLSKAIEINVHVPDDKPGVFGTSFALGTRIAGIVYFRNLDEWYDLSEVLEQEGLTKKDADTLDRLEWLYQHGYFKKLSPTLTRSEIKTELDDEVIWLDNKYFVEYMNQFTKVEKLFYNPVKEYIGIQ